MGTFLLFPAICAIIILIAYFRYTKSLLKLYNHILISIAIVVFVFLSLYYLVKNIGYYFYFFNLFVGIFTIPVLTYLVCSFNFFEIKNNNLKIGITLIFSILIICILFFVSFVFAMLHNPMDYKN